MAVAVSAARDHDPRVARADQRVELRAVAVLGDLEERRLGGGRGPQRATLTAGAPARLSTCTASWSSTQSCSCRCGLANASEARWQIASALPVESVTPNRSCASSAIPRREIRCRAVNVTTAACNRGPNAQTPIGSGTGAGSCAAVPTAQLVRAMLGPGHADRRQLSDLVATEPPARRALLLAEPMPASTARVRVMIDDLLDLILGTQLMTGTRCPGCPPDLRRSPSRMNSLAFARASARSCARDFGESIAMPAELDGDRPAGSGSDRGHGERRAVARRGDDCCAPLGFAKPGDEGCECGPDCGCC